MQTIITQTGYTETTNANDNNKRGWNQQAEIECKYLSGNNMPRIKLIRDKFLLIRAFSDFKAFLYILIGGFKAANQNI